jgi:hypothetical protein
MQVLIVNTRAMDLETLYVYLGSDDKFPRIRQKHIEYLSAYQRHFERFRFANPVILEIGCGYPGSEKENRLGMGGSLSLWHEYFGNGSTVIGIDILPDCKQYEDLSSRIHIEIGSQVDQLFLEHVVDKYGPFDIIIDDGSHLDHHMETTFMMLFPYLKNKGVYAVEDLDGFVESQNSFASNKRFVSFAQDLALRLQKYSERISEQERLGLLDYQTHCLTPLDCMLKSVNFYRNLCVVEKEFSPRSDQMPMPPHYHY